MTNAERDRAIQLLEYYGDKLGCKAEFDLAIKALERPQGEWISVSERLPNEFDEVLCGDKWGGLMIGRIKKNYDGSFTAKDDCDCLVMIDCLAWQPLPKPYKEKENDE